MNYKKKIIKKRVNMEFLVHVKILYASRLREQLCIKSGVAIYSCRFKGLVINYAEGMGYKMGKSRDETYAHPLKTG